MTRTILVLCAVAFVNGGCGDKEGSDSGDTDSHEDDGHGHEDDGHGHEEGGTSLEGNAEAGASVFAASCAGCHGTEGQGDHAPAMGAVVPHHSESEIVSVVLNGSGDMAAVLVDEQSAADVAAYCSMTWGS